MRLDKEKSTPDPFSDQCPPIRRVSNGLGQAVVNVEIVTEQLSSGVHIPKPSRVIPASGYELFAAWGEGYGRDSSTLEDSLVVAMKLAQHGAGVRLPKTYNAIFSA
jgi:hypothetical protein